MRLNQRRWAKRVAGLVTKRQWTVLRQMAEHENDDDGEIAYERGTAYLGDTRIAPRTVFALIRLMAIREDMSDPRSPERYRISEIGHLVLEVGVHVRNNGRAMKRQKGEA